jgi:hypothetical protein
MKTLPTIITLIATSATIGCVSAQSFPPATHASNAATHSGAASGEIIKATGESGQAVVKLGAGAVAVPVMISGGLGTASGEIVSLVGEGAKVSGEAASKGGEKIWDFATSDPKHRPALDRKRTIRPTAKAPVADPSPAQVLNAKR